MIYTVTLNPAFDKTVVIPEFEADTVNRIREIRLDAGGKGLNVSKMIYNLGGVSCAFLALGEAGRDEFQSLLPDSAASVEILEAEGRIRTNLKIIDPIRHTNTDINEPGAVIREETLETWKHQLKQRLKQQDILILSGSVPSGVSKKIYGELTALGRDCKAKVIVDAEGELLVEAIRQRPCLIKPNAYELSVYAGKELRTPEEICRVGAQLVKEGTEQVLIPMGEQGAMLLRKDREDIRIVRAEAPSVTVASTVGAGDSMVGAFAYAMSQNRKPEECFRLAVAAGSAAVTCSGSQAPGKELVERLARQVMLTEL